MGGIHFAGLKIKKETPEVTTKAQSTAIIVSNLNKQIEEESVITSTEDKPSSHQQNGITILYCKIPVKVA